MFVLLQALCGQTVTPPSGGGGGGGSPAGSTGDMQYNAGGGLFGATSGLTWDATNKVLTTTQQYTDLSINPKTLRSNAHLLDVTDDSSTAVYGGIISYMVVDDGSGSVGGSVWAGSSVIDNENNRAGKTVSHAFAHDFEVDSSGSSLPAEMGGSEVNFFVFSPVTSLYGSWVQAPLLFFGATATNLYGYYASDFSGKAANPYYSWDDSRGVLRVKEDNAFDSVGQAITALYNPQFAKYTPGAVNYERLIEGEWNGNVAEIGTYAGGTGTVRPLKLMGSQINLGAASNIGTTMFTGAGLDDGILAGTYTGATLTYCAEIDATGTPDTFKWGTNMACDNGATGVAITGANQALSSGIVIKFTATTGHTLTDNWSAVATAALNTWVITNTLDPSDSATSSYLRLHKTGLDYTTGQLLGANIALEALPSADSTTTWMGIASDVYSDGTKNIGAIWGADILAEHYSSGSVGSLIGVEGYAYNGGGAAGDVVGVNSQAIAGAGSSVSRLINYQTTLRVESGASANTAAGLFVVPVNGSGTINQYAGVDVESNVGLGVTVTDFYGLLIGDLTGALSNWAIKTGLGLVEFGDTMKAPTINITGSSFTFNSLTCTVVAGAIACS